MGRLQVDWEVSSSPYLAPLQFSYVDADGSPVNVVQLTFLKLLSAAAHQRFTYICQNSVAWLDEAAGDHRHSIRFQGTNWEELSFNQTTAATIKVSHDGCRVRPWNQGLAGVEWGSLSSPSSDLLSYPLMARSGRDRRRPSLNSALLWVSCLCGMWLPLTLVRRTKSLGLNSAPSALAAEVVRWEGS